MIDLVYVTDLKEFVNFVIVERALNKEVVLVRIGIDGVQGSLKVVCSIFESDYDPEITFTNKEGPGNWLTGANRLLVLAIAENLQERYENLWTVVKKLKLKEIDYYLACDLKLINSLLSISSHSGKFACPYCDGAMTLESGNLRTFSSLAENYNKFKADGQNMKNMQKYANVINECLLMGEPNKTILSAVPLPELHLLMGLVNWALELLYKVVPQNKLQELMRKKGISVHGYHGGGLDGGNSNLFLNNLEFLSKRTSNNAKE